MSNQKKEKSGKKTKQEMCLNKMYVSVYQALVILINEEKYFLEKNNNEITFYDVFSEFKEQTNNLLKSLSAVYNAKIEKK